MFHFAQTMYVPPSVQEELLRRTGLNIKVSRVYKSVEETRVSAAISAYDDTAAPTPIVNRHVRDMYYFRT